MLTRIVCFLMDHAWRPRFDNGKPEYRCARCDRSASSVYVTRAVAR